MLGSSALGEFALGQEDLEAGPPPVGACSNICINAQACVVVQIEAAVCPSVIVISDCGC